MCKLHPKELAKQRMVKSTFINDFWCQQPRLDLNPRPWDDEVSVIPACCYPWTIVNSYLKVKYYNFKAPSIGFYSNKVKCAVTLRQH